MASSISTESTNSATGNPDEVMSDWREDSEELEDSHIPLSHVASKKRKHGKAFKKPQTNPPEPILHIDASSTAPIQIGTSISMVFRIVHTFEPYHGQILRRYKLDDFFFDHTVRDAPFMRVSVPHSDGTTDDVWLCAKTECNVDPSAYEAFAPSNLAFNYAMATAVSQLGKIGFISEEWDQGFEDNDDGARAQTESVGDQEWMNIDA
ncbi:hypothetical protein LTS10_006812 [Elasticomyces elasticus]|nr:hypothetical protein LTS10_006812 [Elasticomyces elasticus]